VDEDHNCLEESGVTFDEKLAESENLSTNECRKRWPRKTCPKCGTICYASLAHYVYVDG
jgi:hypothetical protein